MVYWHKRVSFMSQFKLDFIRSNEFLTFSIWWVSKSLTFSQNKNKSRANIIIIMSDWRVVACLSKQWKYIFQFSSWQHACFTLRILSESRVYLYNFHIIGSGVYRLIFNTFNCSVKETFLCQYGSVSVRNGIFTLIS